MPTLPAPTIAVLHAFAPLFSPFFSRDSAVAYAAVLTSIEFESYRSGSGVPSRIVPYISSLL